MRYETLTIDEHHPRWHELVTTGILGNAQLVAEMTADAEHDPADYAGVTLAMVVYDGQPAAWAGWRPITIDGRPGIKGVISYERRGPGRDHGLYPVAYALRQQAIVDSGQAAVTYVYAWPDGPDRIHLADGWRATGLSGPAPGGQTWVELRYDPAA